MRWKTIWVATLFLFAASCKQKPDREVDLWFAGDVHLSQPGNGRLADLRGLLSGAIGIANLEGPVGTQASASTKKRLMNDVAAVSELRAQGVQVLTVANNHRLDRGEQGAQETVAALRARGFLVAGGDAGGVSFTDSGLRVAVLAFELARLPTGFASEIRRLAKRTDVVVVAFHSVGPASYLPSDAVEVAVAAAVSAGASVIAVHGSHVPARVERRGSSVIAWGLGNLLFDCKCSQHDEGVIVRVRVTAAGAGRALVIPIRAGLAGADATPDREPQVMFDLLESLGSSPLTRDGGRAWF